MMRISLYLILTLILVGCGSRKKTSENHKESEVTTTSLSEVKQTYEITQDRKQLYELMFTSTWKADSIVTDKQGNTKIYNPNSTTTHQQVESIEESTIAKSDSTAVNTNTFTDSKVEITSTQIDKKQYNWWYGLPLLAIVGALLYITYYLFKKYNLWNHLKSK